jgi:hypothetical protein
MKGKYLFGLIWILVGMALLLIAPPVQASHGTFIAINDVYTALNSGQVDPALAVFADDATAANLVRSETYAGLSEIRQMLKGMQRAGRQFDIVDVEMNGDSITARVEVSDAGHVWGTETIEAVIKGGLLQKFTVTNFRLELWRIGR